MKFFGGVIVGICLPFIGGYLFIISGGMPVATNSKPLPFERYLAGTAIRAAIHHSVIQEPPIAPSDDNMKAGAKVYQQQCEFCHGLPNKGRDFVAKGMFPPPPQLLPPGKGVTDDPVGITYWVVSNGIRTTGMPGFQSLLTPQQIWQVSLFLKNPNLADFPAQAQ